MPKVQNPYVKLNVMSNDQKSVTIFYGDGVKTLRIGSLLTMQANCFRYRILGLYLTFFDFCLQLFVVTINQVSCTGGLHMKVIPCEPIYKII